MMSVFERLKDVSPNNLKKISSGLEFVLNHLEKGSYGEINVSYLIENGHIQHLKKRREETER